MMLHKSVLLVLCVSTIAWAQDDKKAQEDKAKECLSAFKKELREAKNNETAIAQAIARLGEGARHKKVAIQLKAFLGSPSITILSAAAEQLGMYKDDPLAMGYLLDMAARHREKEKKIICLRYAGDVGYRKGAGKFQRFFSDKDVAVAKEAIASAGKIGAKISVDPLLSLLRQLESIRESKPGDANVGGGIGGLGGIPGVGGSGVGGTNVGGTNTLENDQNTRKVELTPAVNTALHDITGESHTKYVDWVKYWRKAKGKFKEKDR